MGILRIHNEIRFRYGVAVAVVLATLAFIFGRPAKKAASVEISDLLSETLSQEQLRQHTENFVQDLIQRDEVHQAVVNIVQKVLNDENVVDGSKKLVGKILNDPHILQQVIILVQNVLADHQIKVNYESCLLCISLCIFPFLPSAEC